MADPALNRQQLISRIAASLLGSYGFVWGFVALGIMLGLAAGLPFEDAETLLSLLSFLLFVVCFCWAYVGKSAVRVWLVLAGGGALMTGAAWFLSRSLG